MKLPIPPNRSPSQILVISDQSLARTNMRRNLEYYGYVVLEASSGRDGLQQFNQEHPRISLVVVDLSQNDVPEEKLDRLALLYNVNQGNGVLAPIVSEDRSYRKKTDYTGGGGGLVSTAADFLVFSQMLLNGGVFKSARILGRKTVELMTCNHLAPELGAIQPFKIGYGLGFSIVNSLAEHQGLGSPGVYGWGGAAGTELWIDPVEKVIGIIMLQVWNMPKDFGLMKRYKHSVYQALV